MRKMRWGIYLLLMAAAVSCGRNTRYAAPNTENTNTYQQIRSMNWIIGKWQINNQDTLSTEIWVLKNDSTYMATSMDVKGGKDTLRYEDITIEQRGNEVYYIPVVKNQNNHQPVTFRLTSFENKKLVFENPQHDFPKKIIYQLRGDSLVPEISGPINGVDVTMKFPMVKAH